LIRAKPTNLFHIFFLFSHGILSIQAFLAFKATIIVSQLENGRQPDIAESTTVPRQLISVGDTKVGKSCIIKRYCEGRFVQKYITTIGVDYGVKKVTVSGRKVAVNFFDLSGSADY
jgi:GTPase SAR1 family protein